MSGLILASAFSPVDAVSTCQPFLSSMRVLMARAVGSSSAMSALGLVVIVFSSFGVLMEMTFSCASWSVMSIRSMMGTSVFSA